MKKLVKVTVTAIYDIEADVWTVTESDVPGLVAEAATIPELEECIRELVPELLQLNNHLLPGDGQNNIPIDFMAVHHNTFMAQECA